MEVVAVGHVVHRDSEYRCHSNSFPDLRRAAGLMSHIRSRRAAHCSRSAGATAPARTPRIDRLTEQPAAIVVFAARREASA